ncbi:hypothetical protein SAMN02745223_02248 [Devosia limi DSM 17137]|uniref:Uncharacterized protein n=1 Tax=Devosia limi DSM 17137 TaxID=1121477 RepID=A0A1M5AGX3_9HYPH|nr:hypothetical protein SAMN02745223_02248 [Devosia limi DSM 17137]
MTEGAGMEGWGDWRVGTKEKRTPQHPHPQPLPSRGRGAHAQRTQRLWRAQNSHLCQPFEHSSHGLPRSNRSTGTICPFGSLGSPARGREMTEGAGMEGWGDWRVGTKEKRTPQHPHPQPLPSRGRGAHAQRMQRLWGSVAQCIRRRSVTPAEAGGRFGDWQRKLDPGFRRDDVVGGVMWCQVRRQARA